MEIGWSILFKLNWIFLFAFLRETTLWRQQSDQMILVPDYSRWRNEWNLNSFPLKSKTSNLNQKKSQPLKFIRKISWAERDILWISDLVATAKKHFQICVDVFLWVGEISKILWPLTTCRDSHQTFPLYCGCCPPNEIKVFFSRNILNFLPKKNAVFLLWS